VDSKRTSKKNGETRVRPRSRRLNRTHSLGALAVSYDLEDRRIVAAWTWIDIQAVNVPTGLRLKIQPALLLFSISYN